MRAVGVTVVSCKGMRKRTNLEVLVDGATKRFFFYFACRILVRAVGRGLDGRTEEVRRLLAEKAPLE